MGAGQFLPNYKPYYLANNQNQVHYLLHKQHHNYNFLFFQQVSYSPELIQQLIPKIYGPVPHLQHPV